MPSAGPSGSSSPSTGSNDVGRRRHHPAEPRDHLIAELGRAVPDDYYSGFVRLGELEVVPPALARDLAPAAGPRNRLVHEYDAIDDARVHAAIARALDLFPRYVQAIEAYLSRPGA